MIQHYGFIKFRAIKDLKTYDPFYRSTDRQREGAPGGEETNSDYLSWDRIRQAESQRYK